MSEIKEVIRKQDPGHLVTMFEIDLSPISGTDTPGDHLYFYPEMKEDNSPLVWKGVTYQPFPIMAEGFDKTVKGTMPRPVLTASNVTGILLGLTSAFDDLVGAKVIRRRTFKQFLDGEAFADPGQHLPDDVYFIERKTQHNKLTMTWELASAMDLEGELLPGRVITATYCPSDYRSGEGCTYAGDLYFNANDESVASLSLDVCSKTVNGCKLRFGSQPLPFGGFPAARVYKT